MVIVGNESTQTATVSFDGQSLTIAVPAGFAIDVTYAVGPTCTPAEGRPNIVQCSSQSQSFSLNFTAVPTVQQVEMVTLSPGCNNITLTWPTGTPAGEVASAVSPASALVAVWRFNNARQVFEGFSPLPHAPSDLVAVDRLDAVFLCLRAPGTLTRPAG